MLVLTRELGERIVIDGGTIVLEVVEIRRGKVKLGFTAATSVTIDREEIHEKKKREVRRDEALD